MYNFNPKVLKTNDTSNLILPIVHYQNFKIEANFRKFLKYHTTKRGLQIEDLLDMFSLGSVFLNYTDLPTLP